MTEEKPQCWYNSRIASGIGAGILCLAGGIGFSYIIRGCGDVVNGNNTVSISPPTIQTADLNGNGIPEKFYTIDGKVGVVEIDGKAVVELYKSN